MATLDASRQRAPGVRLGTLFGIEIRAQWSLLAVFGLLTWSLAAGLIPAEIDDPGPVAAGIAGAAGAILFLGSLLAHELSHSLVARRRGVGVRSITLWLFGGIAQLDRDAPDARAELQISIAGPGMSVLLAVSFGAISASLGATVDASTAGELAALVTRWLATINGLLAVFNLLPGAPLDGGRVLRAWYWHRSGDRLDSQRRAARAGKGLAKLLIAVGLVEFAFGAGAAGLWLAFIGWFVLSAASAEELDAVLRAELQGVRVETVMTRNPATVAPTLAVRDLIDEFLHHPRSTYPVVEGTDLVGLVTLAEIRRLPVARREHTTVADIMVPLAQCPVVGPDEQVVDALRALGGPARILVVEHRANAAHSKLVGIVTPTDIARLVEASSVAAMR